ncbi:MAG TPA: pilus assembly protein TadG-related protein [Dongiaceae bacterium]|nr:pilus assembly protein TadG-related protein [Dongiaceae bacterium]
MRIFGVSHRIGRLGRRLARDEGGAVLIYVSIALTVFMGFAALVIDGGRLFTLDTEMQSAADALALAGAAELDGNTDAITRADAAMTNLVQNNQTFGNGAAAITAYSRRFLNALPADDAPLSDADAFETTDPADARFVQVSLTDDNDRSIDTMFAPAIGGNSTAPADAVAIAGFTSAVCKFTPLFMCNPYEADGIDTLPEFTAKVDTAAERRKIIALHRAGNGAKYAPGNFGFLQSVSDDTKFRESLAKVDPGACFRKDGVETKTGSIVSARQPLNSRFDLWEGSFNNPSKYRNNSAYRPGQNVTKGYTAKNSGSVCNPDLDTTETKAIPFPVDSVIGTNRMGNGDWGGKFNTYWNINHPGVSIPNGWSSTSLPSRYDVYRWEINTSHIPNNSPTGENGHPECSSSAVNDNPDRRVIYAAVINCTAADLQGGSDENVPVVAFLKMFMTQPMTKEPGHTKDDETADADNTLFVEMIDVVAPGTDDAVVHDIVQLYR